MLLGRARGVLLPVMKLKSTIARPCRKFRLEEANEERKQDATDVSRVIQYFEVSSWGNRTIIDAKFERRTMSTQRKMQGLPEIRPPSAPPSHTRQKY